MDAATIAAIGSSLAAVIGAAALAYATVASARAKIAADLSTLNADRLAKMGDAVKLLEVNTNSIKDALVRATADASRLAGEKAGRADLKAEQALGTGANPAPVPVTIASPTPLPVTVTKPARE